MNVIIFMVGLLVLVILGFVAKSVIAMMFGAVGLAISFLVFCASSFFSILGNVFVYAIGIAAFAATIIFIPALLILIIPGIWFLYSCARKKRPYGSAYEILKLKY